MNYHYLLFIPLFIAGVAVGCAEPQTQAQEDADRAARRQAHNVRMQPRVNSLAEVWYKGHRYLVYEAHRKFAITHAGHCEGLHVTRIGGEVLDR